MTLHRCTHALEKALLLEGLESGAPIEVTDDYIQQKRTELLARIQKGEKSGR